ncbi:MAG: CapA family protein [Candidatus Paceibacterota bacterium]
MKSNWQKKIKLGFWAVSSMAVGVLFMLLVFYGAEQIIQRGNTDGALAIGSTVQSFLKKEIVEETPKYFYLNKDENGGPRVSARAYLVGDLNTGEVILAKNQEEQLPVASITKLMTALVADEIADKDETTQVSRRALATYGTNGNLRSGERIKIKDLLYPLLLESSNDASEVIAEHFERDTFIKKMNEVAEGLKMSDTSYADPSGLSKNNQSTATDIFRLVGYLKQQKEEMLKITTLRSYSNKNHSWSNINQLAKRDGYLGGKSGYTDVAKQTVVSLFALPLGEFDHRPIAITLLQSSDRQRDIESILKYLEKNVYYGGASDARNNWVQEKIGIPHIKDPDFVTLTFGGDIMLTRGVKNSVRKNFNNDYSKLFEKESLINLLKKSDIVFANLEGPVSDKGTDMGNLYSFRMDPEVIPALHGAGINVLSVANNHVGDWGRIAYIDTLARLKENEIFYTGAGNDKIEAETPIIIEKYGMKIGFLAFSDTGPNWMEATAEQAGILLASDPRFTEIIQKASTQVDYLIVSFHFGAEYKTQNNTRQQNLAHKAIDSGAKVVIGHHPHVIQNTEVYKNGFIAYSLGNFIFDQSWSAPTMQGMLLGMKIWRDGSISIQKNTMQLNKTFQPDQITIGKEEKIIFE